MQQLATKPAPKYGMSLDKKIANIAGQREAEEARESRLNKEVADRRMAAKRVAFAEIRDKFKRFENTEIADSLRVTYGEWGATIHLKDTTYTSLWTRIWPFRSDKAAFNSKPTGKRWKVTAVLDQNEQVVWVLQSMFRGRGAGGSRVLPRRDLNRALDEIEDVIAATVISQRNGEYWR